MITTTDRPAPTVVGAKSEVGFTIDPRNLAHVVSLLRDAYSDPITAVLREYSVNAADAHVEAGIPDKPIRVTLPGRLEPVLKIRDFGRGLTPEQIESLFCSYGASSKRTSNDYTGCLGIGCKSAFAITDSFTVTTFHGGRARSYSCFLDESEVGKAVLLSDKPSNETGVLVSIPVKKDDIGTVENKAIEVYKYFKIRPEFENLGNSRLQEITRPAYLYRTDGVGLRNGNSWRSNDSNIVMGNIAYPIKLDELGHDKIQEILGYTAFDIEVPIGAVDIAPSREELKYNARTKKAVLEAVEDAFKRIGKSAADDIAKSNDLFTAIKIFKACFQRHKLDGYLRGLGHKPVYKGKELTSCDIKLYDKEEEAKQHGFAVRRLVKLNTVRRGKSYQFAETNTMEIGLDDKLYHDTSSNQMEFYGRVRTLLSDPHFRSAYVFKTRNGGMDYLRNKQPLLNEMTFDDFTAIEVTPPEKADTNVRGPINNAKHSMQVFKLKPDDKLNEWQRHQSEYWLPSSVDLKNDSGVYFAIDRFQITTDSHTRDVRDYAERIKLLRRFGYKGELYGFKPAVVERLKKSKSTNWVLFHDKFEELWEARVSSYREAMNNYLNYQLHHSSRDGDLAVIEILHKETFAEGTVVSMYKEALDKCLVNPPGVDLAKEAKLVDGHLAMLPTVKPTLDLDGLFALFRKRYPMTMYWSLGGGAYENESMKVRQTSNTKLLVDYLKLVDANDSVISTSTTKRKDKGE
jgi:hypothetical protein